MGNICSILVVFCLKCTLSVQDGESGWSSLHRALHFGHLAVASALLQFGASLALEDSKCRTPVDLLSGPLSQIVGNALDSGTFLLIIREYVTFDKNSFMVFQFM